MKVCACPLAGPDALFRGVTGVFLSVHLAGVSVAQLYAWVTGRPFDTGCIAKMEEASQGGRGGFATMAYRVMQLHVILENVKNVYERLMQLTCTETRYFTRYGYCPGYAATPSHEKRKKKKKKDDTRATMF